MKHAAWLLTGLLILTGSVPGVGEAAQAGQERPNIVLILSDDHNWNDHGFMGNDVVQTPRLDALAAQSMVYTRAYNTASLCRPSIASLLTSLYPRENGITGNDPPGGSATQRDPAARAAMVEVFARHTNFVEMLRDAGYATFQTGKWWEGNPTERGFTAGMTHGDPTRGGRHGDDGLDIGRQGIQPVRDYIDSAGDRPFFLWYAPIMPHMPHNPPEQLLAKYQALLRDSPGGEFFIGRQAAYYAMIEWFDQTVGELLDYLEEKGLAENTVVIYLADNGWISASEPGQGANDTRSKLSYYDAGYRTPLMIRWPGRVAPGRDTTSLASSLDVAPTVLRAAGLDPLPGMRGFDLIGERDRVAERQYAFMELNAHTAVEVDRPLSNLIARSVTRKDGWRLIVPYAPNQDVALTNQGARPWWLTLDTQLYNVWDDPFETRNLAGERPDLMREPLAELDRWYPVEE
ncbi:MAG TPA: sulfatase [Longimicrobiales bacterium]|nr:sulfatase [Longimicrobiales bacterium]